MVRHAGRHRAAFSLIEAIVAVVILGVGLSAVIGLTSDAVSSQSRGEMLDTAARLADERLQLVLAVGPEEYPAAFGLRGECDEPFQRFAHEVAIVPGGAGEPYTVIATISWNDGGRPRSVVIETRIAPRLGDEADNDRQPEETMDRNSDRESSG